jgi:malonate-semialdehyde dehydrogenase (acetylating)/methylmalonate-semialdehyde dehydrogenase
MTTTNEKLLNYVGNEWTESQASEYLDVLNPATTDILARVPLSPPSEVDHVVALATEAFHDWRRTPAVERVQYLFKLKTLLEEHADDLARTITMECGKTLGEAKGEVVRAIDNVEVACGIPTLMQGYNLEDIAVGIDEFMIRQPVGVAAAICPFNFPGMIPFWFFPYAIACGNTYLIKPSERTPITLQKVFQLIEQTGIPKGVINLVNGSKDTVNAILEHPDIKAISFVGSTAVAKYVYGKAAENGKRAQCQGGAKNLVIVMPDADMEMTRRIVADSAFGSAGQRCAAASLAVTVGEAEGPFTEAISETAVNRVTGYGLDEGVEMGPVISTESKTRIEGIIQGGADEGAEIVVDGRHPVIPGYEDGYFVKPTVVSDVPPAGEFARTEIFGPVLGMMHVENVDQAIDLVNKSQYGNMACLFTNDGSVARRFRYEADAGNIGINIGIAAPMAFFPFSGWKDSFFGDMHGQGRDAVEFFTQKKVVIERWFEEWTRKF